MAARHRSIVCGSQQLGDRHEFLARLAKECAAALLGGVNGCPIRITHDLRSSPTELHQQLIWITGAPRPVRGQVSKDSLSRGQAAGAIRSDRPDRAPLAPSTGVETGNDCRVENDTSLDIGVHTPAVIIRDACKRRRSAVSAISSG